MTDNLTKAQRHKNMQNIRSAGTLVERLFMKELRRRGIYFSKYAKSLPGTPDVVFRKNQVAVFIDSEFWHGRPGNFVMPKTNRAYWKKKIAGNRARDKRVNDILRRGGWKVLRFWEGIVKKNPVRCVDKTIMHIQPRTD